MSPDLAKLNDPFAEEELRQFQGRGGQTMTYIEDETVMDRLDASFGIGGWQILVEPIPVYDGVVKVKLGVRLKDEWTWYEDFGYPNQAGGDVLKEAVSDGIRRCGRYLGIARDLYRKRTYETAQTARPRPAPVPTPIKPQRTSTEPPEFPDDGLSAVWDGDPTGKTLPPLPAPPYRGAQPKPLEQCPIHPGEVWRGNVGDLYHKMPDGSGYCRPEGQPKKAKAR